MEHPAALRYATDTSCVLASGQAWVIAWHAPVVFARFFRQPTASDFADFIRATAEEMDACPLDRPRAVLHQVDVLGSVDAVQRKAAAEMLARRREKLGKICTGYVFCSASPMTRGIMKVVHWLSPPPYPSFTASNIEDGLRHLQTVDPRIEPNAYLQYYRRLVLSPSGETEHSGMFTRRGSGAERSG